jgi:hypothetical protein
MQIMPIMQKRIVITFIIISISVSLLALDIEFPEIKGFKIHKNYPVFVPDNLWDFINGAADTYLALGFVDLHVAEYKKGKEVIKLEIYRHSDPVMAFGIYASERSPSFRFMDLGAQGYTADGAINFFKGNYYVKIRTYSKKAKTNQAAESLAVKVASMLEGESELPPVLSLFPQEGRKLNEETFINENVLGHNFLSKAFKASYEAGPDNFSVYILQSPSPEESRKMVEVYLASTGVAIVDNRDKYTLNDGYNGTVFLAWKQNKIILIQGLNKDKSELSEKYFSEILK